MSQLSGRLGHIVNGQNSYLLQLSTFLIEYMSCLQLILLTCICVLPFAGKIYLFYAASLDSLLLLSPLLHEPRLTQANAKAAQAVM